MRSFVLLILSLFYFSVNPLFATVYTTTGDGRMNANIWSPGVPSSPLAAGDEIIIAHDVDLNLDFIVHGKMTINSGASLNGNKKLKIGEGSTTGELINNGEIDIKELIVKGDNSVSNLTAPSISNNGSINVNKLHVGDNAGAGILNNSAGSTISVSIEAHIDNVLNNEGEITSNKIELHGGTLQGSGNMTTDLIEFDNNNGRQGTITDQNICGDFSSSSEPQIKVKGGGTYSSLSDFVDGETASGTEHSISESDFYSCGVNALGMALPVELTFFNARTTNLKVILDWGTASELNSDYFVIEKSADAVNFFPLGEIETYGTTNEQQYYNYVDKNPFPVNYYRLKQIDTDGTYVYSEIITISLGKIVDNKLTVFPSVAYDQIKIKAELRDNSPFTLSIYNSFGHRVYHESNSTSDSHFSTILDVSNFDQGQYNMVLQSNSKLVTSRFIVTTQR